MKAESALITALALFLLTTIQPAISVKLLGYYEFRLREDLPTHIAVEDQDRVWLSLPSRMEVVLFMPKTGEMFAISLPGLPSKILYYEGLVVVALGKAKSVAVIDARTFDVDTLKLKADVVDMYPTKDGIWLALPDVPQVVLFSPLERKVLREVSLNVAAGEGVMAESDGRLWVIDKSYRSLLTVDTASGSVKAYEVGNQTYLLAPAKGGGVWAVTVEGYLIRVTNDLKLAEKVALPAGTVVAPPLLSTDYGSLVYFCRPRNSAGEVFDGSVEEIRLGLMSPWHPTKGPDDTFWFIDITRNGIGVVTISRPPTIRSAWVEKLGDKAFRVFAEVEDREGDVKNVVAVVEQYVGGRLVLNSTFGMGMAQGRAYAGDGNVGIEEGIVKVKVLASDAVGNVAYSHAGNITVKDGVIVGIELKKGEGQGAGIQVYVLVSELLLLIPVVLAVLYVLRKRFYKRK